MFPWQQVHYGIVTIETLRITNNDNIKTRLINHEPQNKFVDNLNKKIRSQWDTYNYFNNILD